ncbi:hypothetical protein KPH14_008099 [Odynerus spinipes]|uniref:Major facilitator superfamily (MFS) profile domain-containing protein n=1 Tax=Odynerus spinipes TaxID=1348599 RepID=A0AAD9VNJ5_9HYME|nr:hypothetical protein KPH14_008099 [Odynerus spinipes]
MSSKNTNYSVFDTSIGAPPATKKLRGEGQQTDEVVAQDALNETGFGKFNYKVLAVCALICINAAFSTLSIGFILPAAACDFKMTTEDKGHLTVSFMLGMFVSSYFWGCLADTKGRKASLLLALFIHGGSEFLASLIPFYWGFLILKFISGLAICGQITLLYTYLAEFQPRKKRDLFLALMETSWVTGIILVACVAWIIVPLNIEYKSGILSFRSWNLFVMMCSLPALIVGTWLTFFPETPKYLADTGQNAKMLNVLARMYSENTGNPSEEYFANLKKSGNQMLIELLVRITDRKNEQEEIKVKSLKDITMDIFSQTLMLVKQPYLRRTFILCLVTYLIMSSYYMLILWLPDLFQRYAEFQDRFPNQSASVCTVILIKNNETIMDTNSYGCDTPIQNHVYFYALILALACVPVGLSLPLLIDRMGYTFFLVSSTLVASLATLCFFLVKTSVDNLVVSCFFESLTSMCVGVVWCMIVDLYPTHLRSIAAGLASFFGRLGSIMGNLMTGLLIDTQCTMLISLVAVQLFLCGVLGLLTPKREKPEKNVHTHIYKQISYLFPKAKNIYVGMSHR